MKRLKKKHVRLILGLVGAVLEPFMTARYHENAHYDQHIDASGLPGVKLRAHRADEEIRRKNRRDHS